MVETFAPTSPQELADVVKAHGRIVLRGGATKPALLGAIEGAAVLDVRELSGILEYDPREFTFTARAGTSLRQVDDALAEHGQYLPFDPPLMDAGATLGGTVAAGLSGPGRQRHGGVRDFILAVRYVDGRGELLRGGAPVVKNAAGFDLPKLMVGSLGRLAALAELTFKIFPRPQAWLTGCFELEDLEEARQALVRLLRRPFDLDALELESPGLLTVRLGGSEESLPRRLERIAGVVGVSPRHLDGEADAALWRGLREFAWAAPGAALVEVPLTPSRIPALEAALAEIPEVVRRYGAGACRAHLALAPGNIEDLARALRDLGLAGLLLRPAGVSPDPLIGQLSGEALRRRIASALDPEGRFQR